MKTALMITIIVFSTAASDVLMRGARRVKRLCLQAERDYRDCSPDNVNVAFFRRLDGCGKLLCLLDRHPGRFEPGPPATSLSYVIATLGSKIILKERINRLRWTGTFFVCAGVALISLP